MSVQQSFGDYFRLAKFFLRAAGILPFGGPPSLWKSFLTQFLVLAPVFYGFFIVIPQINYILFRNHAMDEMLEAVIITITILGGQFRTIFLSINRRKTTRLFAVCETLWDHADLADYKVILIWGKRARLFSMMYFCAANFSITSFVFATTVTQMLSPANSTKRLFPFEFTEDFTPSPYYEFKYILHVLIGYFGNSFIVVADMTGTLLALNICGQLALIRIWLVEISKGESKTAGAKIDESREEALKKCIRRHQIVMDCCVELEEVVQYINLIQLVTGMYVLAISGARLAQSLESYRYIGPLVLAIIGLFCQCWPADNLFFASSDVADEVYGFPWYRCSPRERTAVAIMLARSQRPAKLTAGKFVPLSLATYSSTLSSAVSLCMVLSSF